MTIDDPEGVGSESFPDAEEQVTSAAETPEAETDELETGENGTGEGDEETEAEAETQRKKNPVQERIDTMYAKQKEAEKLADYWRGVAEGRSKPAEEAGEQQPDANERPDPTQYEFGEADPAYIEALTDWKVDTRLAALEQKQGQRTAEQQLNQAYAQHVAAVKEELPDYDEKVTRTLGQWPCPKEVAELIKKSPVGPKVAYHLATNLDDAIAIEAMSPIDRAAAFGMIAAHIANQPTKQPKIATNAPEPAPARTKGGQFASPNGLDDRLSTEEWMRRREAQVRAR